jgi:hypothetical protein
LPVLELPVLELPELELPELELPELELPELELPVLELPEPESPPAEAAPVEEEPAALLDIPSGCELTPPHAVRISPDSAIPVANTDRHRINSNFKIECSPVK